MAAYLLAGFDTARVGSMSVAVSDGFDSGTATVTGTYAHRDLSSVMGSGEYTSFVAGVEAALDAVLTTSGSSLAYNVAAASYTIFSGGGPTLDFRSTTLGNDSGKRLAAALGFNYQNNRASGGSASDPYNIQLSGDTIYESNVKPYYYLALARDGLADYSRDFEPTGQTKRQVSVNANAYSVGPLTYERRTKFKMRFNTLATVHASEASSAVPWTYEHLVQHARAWEPILLSYSEEDLVYKLVDAEFSEDARKPVWNDYHAKWDLAVQGQVLGRL